MGVAHRLLNCGTLIANEDDRWRFFLLAKIITKNPNSKLNIQNYFTICPKYSLGSAVPHFSSTEIRLAASTKGAYFTCLAVSLE